jgi:hypothetical protein
MHGTEYAVQCERELIIMSICGAVLTLNSELHVPEAKNVLSGSPLVQGKGHCVEIDTVGTRIMCNTGSCSTLHMSYDEENELWYLIGSWLKVPAEINAVTSKSKMTTVSGNSKIKVVNNSKVEVFWNIQHPTQLNKPVSLKDSLKQILEDPNP